MKARFLPLALLIMGSVFADCDYCWDDCTCCYEEDCITPRAVARTFDGASLFINAEFLYWTAREDRLGFAYTSPIVTGEECPSIPRGKVYHPDWGYDPGFRVGAGIAFCHDGWDLQANYTWLRPDAKDEVKAGEDPLLATLWGLEETVLSARGIWSLNFNVIDLELGRNFFISRYLKLRPHFGLKGTFGEQKFRLIYLLATEREEIKNRNCYWGIGIRGGLDTSWHFTPCFSIFGDLAITTLWESFKVSRRDFSENFSNGLFSSSLGVKNSFSTIRPIIELTLGLRFETWFCCDSYHFSLEAGWEQQWWGGQNQFFQSSIETRGGDLILQGLTIKARFDF